jgi:hypothetical protein
MDCNYTDVHSNAMRDALEREKPNGRRERGRSEINIKTRFRFLALFIPFPSKLKMIENSD